MSDEIKERNILKLILIVRFACATLDVGHPIALVCSILRESSNNDLFDINGWDSKSPIILTGNGINRRTKLAIGI
jgi:hypothetical protein